jgi:hypothetical protein
MVGSTTLWIAAFVAAGLLWGWPAVLITLKPSYLPFALIGIRHRSWWVAAAALGVLSLPLWSAWGDYATVLRNAEFGTTYLSSGFILASLPPTFLPLVAWVGRRRTRGLPTLSARSLDAAASAAGPGTSAG